MHLIAMEEFQMKDKARIAGVGMVKNVEAASWPVEGTAVTAGLSLRQELAARHPARWVGTRAPERIGGAG